MELKQLMPAFLAATLAGTAAAKAADTPGEPLLVVPIHAPGTLIVPGTHPNALNDHTLQFEVDATGKEMAYFSSNRIGLVPQGQSDSQFKDCPYFKYDRARYAIEQDRSKPGRILKITAQVTQAQIDAVSKSQCLVTDKPPMGDIKGLSLF